MENLHLILVLFKLNAAAANKIELTVLYARQIGF